MQKKLLLTYTCLALVVLLISTGTFWSKGYEFINQQNEELYRHQTEVLLDLFENSGLKTQDDYESFVKTYAEKYQIRLTVIDEEGDVVADSEKENLDNHENREEVRDALEGNEATITRYSETMRMKYFYCAVPAQTTDFRGVLRVSVPLDEIKELDRKLRRSVSFSVILALIFSGIIAMIFSRNLTKPIDDVANVAERITEGEYKVKIYTRDKHQIGRMAASFNSMANKLDQTIHNLTRRNTELEAMLTSMTSGIVAISDANNILFWNNAFKELAESPKEELSGESLYTVIRNSTLFDVIDQVRKDGVSICREGKLNISREKMIRIKGTPLRENEENNLGVLLVIEDVTELKKLETMRSDFVSNVTHELKTPLTSIRGFVDTLKGGAINDEKVAKKFLDIIDIEAERLYTLIQDILLLSEIESGSDRDKQSCQINGVVTEVIELLRPRLNEETKLVFKPVPYLKPYQCNRDRMKQLLINLVDNAIKNTEKGSVEVSCENDGSCLVITVKDTGIGISEENLERIFERFYRVDKGRSRKMGGTGLGLSIVKHIVEMYNGNIIVESRIDVGTTFIIRLPY